jgi:hypothetical protein
MCFTSTLLIILQVLSESVDIDMIMEAVTRNVEMFAREISLGMDQIHGQLQQLVTTGLLDLASNMLNDVKEFVEGT